MIRRRELILSLLCLLGTGRIAYAHFFREDHARIQIDARYAPLLAALPPEALTLGYLSDEADLPSEAKGTDAGTAIQRMSEHRRYLDALYALAPRDLRFDQTDLALVVADFTTDEALQAACERQQLTQEVSLGQGLALVTRGQPSP